MLTLEAWQWIERVIRHEGILLHPTGRDLNRERPGRARKRSECNHLVTSVILRLAMCQHIIIPHEKI